MIDLLETLKADTLQARKDRDVDATLLVTISSDIAKRGKDDGGRQPTVDDAIKVLKTYIGGLDENLKLVRDMEKAAEILRQRDRLSAYLPTALVGDDLAAEIAIAAREAGVPIEIKSMSAILTVLTQKFPGRVDGKAVSLFIKSRAA